MLRARPLQRRRTGDIPLLLAALARCAAVRVALWVLPSHRVLRFVHRRVAPGAMPTHHAAVPVDRVAWAARAAGRRVPGATCLVNALTAQLMLARHGHASDLRIGVARDERNRFNAHAWVEVDGRAVVGGGEEHRFTVLPDLAGIL